MLNKLLKKSAIAFFAVALMFSAMADEPVADEPATAGQPETENSTETEDKEFDPTEKIIEDLSVPFPVDI